jgi:stage II sporulation protein D
MMRWISRSLMVAAMAVLVAGGCSCEKPQKAPPPSMPIKAPVAGKEVPLIRARLGDEMPSVAVGVMGPWRLVGPAGEVASGATLEWTEVSAGGGRLIFVATEADTVRVTNVLPLEMYVAGVLANELPRAWNVEAYKAQAVAARTYALAERNLRTGPGHDFDVYDSTASQVYGGCETETATAWEAVTKTWGLAASYKGADGKTYLLMTYYHSTCGGMTVPAGAVFGGPTPPPLAGGVPCSYCAASPKYRWPDVRLSKQEITEALKRSPSPELARLGPVAAVKVESTLAPGGRATVIRVTDRAGLSVPMPADTWRRLVSPTRIFSTWFNIQDDGNSILITDGRGYGHGVGLCQWGAAYLAERGKTGEEIVRYYYPSAELTRAY